MQVHARDDEGVPTDVTLSNIEDDCRFEAEGKVVNHDMSLKHVFEALKAHPRYGSLFEGENGAEFELWLSKHLTDYVL